VFAHQQIITLESNWPKTLRTLITMEEQ